MIIELEFEIDSSNQKLIEFFKVKRWAISNFSRKSEIGKLFLSRNTLHYDNFHKLLWQAIVLPCGDFIFYDENKKEFDLQVKKSKKNKIELKSGFTPSPELISIVQGAFKFGTIILRTIGDNTEFNKYKKIELVIEDFNKNLFLKQSMEICFKK